MNIEDIYWWASRYHYPSLRLSETERLSAGRAEWNLYLQNVTEEGLARLTAAIERWDAFMARGRESA